ncbi:lipase esterase [Fusarium coicis]|nr:lipase esterase [Fusarium coicis]
MNVKPSPISNEVRKRREEFANVLEAQLAKEPAWHDFPTPALYREARRHGTHGLRAPWISDEARMVKFHGRDNREICLRVFEPPDHPSCGVWLHFHAVAEAYNACLRGPGGWVLGGSDSYDAYLLRLSKKLGITTASVEYRLAPEHPFPAGLDDCVDASLYALSPKGREALGGPLRIIGGESAGAWLAVAVALRLRDEHGIDPRVYIDAICAGYGIYDLTYTPSLINHTRAIVLSKKSMMDFTEAAFGHVAAADRKAPGISPLYADLRGLPPAQFLVGTYDPLLDDSIFMAVKWSQAGNEAELTVVDGGCHAFTLMPMEDSSEEGMESLFHFAQQHLKQSKAP